MVHNFGIPPSCPWNNAVSAKLSSSSPHGKNAVSTCHNSLKLIYRRPYARRALTHFGLMPEGP